MNLNNKILIGSAFALPIVVFGIKAMLKSPQEKPLKVEELPATIESEEAEAEEEKRKIMREMASRGGKKSKRGKAKPKEVGEDGSQE